MSKHIPKLLIIDILQSIDKIFEFTAGMNYDQFFSDSKTQDAVLRNIGVIGEAIKHLPDQLKVGNPHIEWGRIVRSRNIVVHEYGNIDLEVIWKIKSVHLLPLRNSLEKILKELES